MCKEASPSPKGHVGKGPLDFTCDLFFLLSTSQDLLKPHLKGVILEMEVLNTKAPWGWGSTRELFQAMDADSLGTKPTELDRQVGEREKNPSAQVQAYSSPRGDLGRVTTFSVPISLRVR